MDIIVKAILLYASIAVRTVADESFTAIKWNITARTQKNEKTILKNAFGAAGEGRLHAIIGPSGSGKTTLLNALSGTTPKASLSLKGEVSCAFDTIPVFVQQDDLLFAQLTVDETLSTLARLKAIKSDQENDIIGKTLKSVERLVLDLGLKKVSKTRVGDSKTRGISGGERKRLSIGNEIIGENSAAPTLIFCDEPTSGLDSFQAQRVMQLLKDLANKGNTVIASIHQPRASIVNLLDEITLMSEGRVIYSGDTKEMSRYFSRLGYKCPVNVNPVEHYIDLLSVDYSTKEEEDISRSRITALADAFASDAVTGKVASFASARWRREAGSIMSAKRSDVSALIGTKPRRGGFLHSIGRSLSQKFRTCRILFVRALRQVMRDKALNIARLASGVFSALLFGAIYFKLGNGAATVPDRLGLLQVAAVNVAMSALIKATTSFVNEKLIVSRERRSASYDVAPYFFSKLVAEVPISAFFPCLSGAIMYKLCGLNPAPGRLLKFLGILVLESFASSAMGMAVGSVVPSAEAGIAIAPAIMTIFIVFGGLYVVNVPWYLSWVPKVSLIRWAYEALCINEFTSMTLTPAAATGSLSVSKGEQVLQGLGLDPSRASITKALKAQAGILFFNYALTYLSLLLQKPSFEQIESTSGTGTSTDPTTSVLASDAIALEQREEGYDDVPLNAVKGCSSTSSAAATTAFTTVRAPLL